jgi:hypothetical protein
MNDVGAADGPKEDEGRVHLLIYWYFEIDLNSEDYMFS